jgi:hypothetical protein
MPRKKLQRLVRRKGGIPTAGAEVTGATTVLVRGDSSVWAFGDYGTKELDAARLIRKGASISLVCEMRAVAHHPNLQGGLSVGWR